MIFLVLTLRDEQSALLLLVSARMATQKTQGIEELKVFNEKAKEVSQYVEARVRNIFVQLPKWSFYKGYHIRLYHLGFGWHTLECSVSFWARPH